MKVRAKDPSAVLHFPNSTGTGTYIITGSWMPVPKEEEDYFRKAQGILEIDEEKPIEKVVEKVVEKVEAVAEKIVKKKGK